MEVGNLHWYENYPESEMMLRPMYTVDFSYPAHLHSCMEVAFCVGGQVRITADGRDCDLTAGQAMVIPPNTIHSYHSGTSSACYVILFSRSLLADFSAMFSHRKPRYYVFAMDEGLQRQLEEFYLSGQTQFGGKSLLYRAAECFLRGNEFYEAESSDDLTANIASYLQDNLSREITLQELADHLGYSYFYISKRIRQVFGVPFTTLLAQYRTANAKMLLDSRSCTITQAALASGFGSIRTFNRVFHHLTGQTPSQYLSGPRHLNVFLSDG